MEEGHHNNGLREHYTLLLLGTVALVLLLVGGVALGRQNDSEPPSKQLSGEGDVSIQPFIGAQASFESGSADPTYMLVQVSDHGFLTVFMSPAGVDSVFAEGYALCSSVGQVVHGYDVEAQEPRKAPRPAPPGRGEQPHA